MLKKKKHTFYSDFFLAGALANTKTMTSEEVEVTFAAHLLFGALALPAPPCWKEVEIPNEKHHGFEGVEY